VSLSERMRDHVGRPARSLHDLTGAASRGEEVITDAVAELKGRAQEALFARLGVRLFDSTLTEEQLQAFIAQEITELMS
jgi:hypothetical protein